MSNPTDQDRMNYLTAHEIAHIRSVDAAMDHPENRLMEAEEPFLFLAMDGTTCWGKTFREAVDRAMEHDHWKSP